MFLRNGIYIYSINSDNKLEFFVSKFNFLGSDLCFIF